MPGSPPHGDDSGRGNARLEPDSIKGKEGPCEATGQACHYTDPSEDADNGVSCRAEAEAGPSKPDYRVSGCSLPASPRYNSPYSLRQLPGQAV